MLSTRQILVYLTVVSVLCLMLDPSSAVALARIGVYQVNDRNALLTTKLLSTVKPSVRRPVTPVNRENYLVTASAQDKLHQPSVPSFSRRPVRPIDLLLFHQPDQQSQTVFPGVNLILTNSRQASETTTPMPPPVFHAASPWNNDNNRYSQLTGLVHSPGDGAQMSKGNAFLRGPFFTNDDEMVQHGLELSKVPSAPLPVIEEKDLLDRMAAPQYDRPASNLFQWLMMVQPVTKPVDPVKKITFDEIKPDDYEVSDDDVIESREDVDYFTDEDYFTDDMTTETPSNVVVTEPTVNDQTSSETQITTTTELPTTPTTTMTTPTTPTTPMTTLSIVSDNVTDASDIALETRQQMELEQLPVQRPRPFFFPVDNEASVTVRPTETSSHHTKSIATDYQLRNMYANNGVNMMYLNPSAASNQYNMYMEQYLVTQRPMSSGGMNISTTSAPVGPPYINTSPSSVFNVFQQQTNPLFFQSPISSFNTVTPAPIQPFTNPTSSKPLDIFAQQPTHVIEHQMGNSNGNFGNLGGAVNVLRPPFFNPPSSGPSIMYQQPLKPIGVVVNQMGENNGDFISNVRPTLAPAQFDLFQQQKPPLPTEYQMGNGFIQQPVSGQEQQQPSPSGSSYPLPPLMMPGYFQMGGYYHYTTTTTKLTTTTPSYGTSSNLPCPPTTTTTPVIVTELADSTTSNPTTTSLSIKPSSATKKPSRPSRPSKPTSSTLLTRPQVGVPVSSVFIQPVSSGSDSTSSDSSTSFLGVSSDVTSSSGIGATGFLLFFFFIGLPIIIGVLSLLDLPEIVLGILIAGVVPISLFLILGVTGVLASKRSISSGRDHGDGHWFNWRIISANELRRLERDVLHLLESYPYREDDR